MRAMLAQSFVAALALAGISGAASAQTLVSADNGTTTTYTAQFNQLYLLDGANTAISFKTTVANEVVTLSFAADRCGITQTAAQTNNVLNESFVQGFFYIDGALLTTSTGNARSLCAYNVFPQAHYMTQSGAAQTQQRVAIPTPGIHTMSFLLQVGVTTDGSNIFPVFGETHASVSRK